MATKYGTSRNDTITGTNSNDFLFGGAGNDTLYGLARRDYLSGGIGNDTLDGGLGNDILDGGSGADKFDFGHLHDADIIEDFSPSDVIALSEGIEAYVVSVNEYGNVRIATIDEDFAADPVQGSIVLSGVSEAEWTSWGGELGWFSLEYYDPGANPNAPLIVFEDLGNAYGQTITGNDGANILRGLEGNDELFGLGGSDRLLGGFGNDVVDGGAGGDVLLGQRGADDIYTGGADGVRDRVVYSSLVDSGMTSAGRDDVFQFVHGQDKLDLRSIDANLSVSGNQAFKVVSAFTSDRGEVRLIHTASGNTIVQVDGDNDAAVDMTIRVVNAHLTATDLLL